MRFEPAGYEFCDTGLLTQALTHRSAGNRNNERLEFLGDAVLGLVISDAIYARFTSASEGDLSRLRSRLVRKETLASVAKEHQLGDHIKLGQGELATGGHRRSSILADAVEAVLGAVYLDGGFNAAATVIERWFRERIEALPDADSLKDSKTRLQEYLQARQHPLPQYELVDTTGADHARTFYVRCSVNGLELVQDATGTSRRKAEQASAQKMLEALLHP